MGNDNEELMAWLESSLEYVRERRQVKLTELLESVRSKVVLEADLAEGACPITRAGSTISTATSIRREPDGNLKMVRIRSRAGVRKGTSLTFPEASWFPNRLARPLRPGEGQARTG
jgi:hypothetical protein